LPQVIAQAFYKGAPALGEDITIQLGGGYRDDGEHENITHKHFFPYKKRQQQQIIRIHNNDQNREVLQKGILGPVKG
jgi:hypothetical protein